MSVYDVASAIRCAVMEVCAYIRCSSKLDWRETQRERGKERKKERERERERETETERGRKR